MIENIFFLIISGLILRFSLSFTGQNWVKTYQQTIAFLVLPVVTFVITKTITGNIALSLGMIGALSIVRFRNPVKSALELVMYFVLITLGIAASVNIEFAYILLATCIIIISGTSKAELLDLLNKNTYSKLSALTKLNEYKKV